jgi:protease-4
MPIPPNRRDHRKEIEMKKIIKASGRGILKLSMLLGLIVLVLAVVGLFSFRNMIMGDDDTKPLPKQFTLFHEFNGSMTDINRQGGFLSTLMPREIDLIGFLKSLDDAKTDPRVTGLAVNIHDGDYSLTQLQSIRNAVIDFSKSGKKTIAYSSAYGDFSNGLGEYWLASAFDEIWVQPIGLVSLNGIRIEQPYARDALDKIGVEPQILQRKSYKTGPETYVRDGMSDEAKETLVSISEGMMSVILGDIATARNLPLTDVARAVNISPLTDKGAYKLGLIDTIGYTDQIEAALKTGDDNASFISIERYIDQASNDDAKAPAQVAIVTIDGMILDGTMMSNMNALLVPSDFADSSKISANIMNAADDDDIKVILIRVNSPGGSPTASETIRRAVTYARARDKYVIVSMGDVAASGGYWVSVNANQIIASNLTITGSIGVYGGKMNLSGLWDKIGVNWDAVKVGQNASMWSMNTGYNETELNRLNAMMDDIYNAFITRVSEGRTISMDDAETAAQGRAWMGTEARDKQLVDLIGGFEFALKRAAGEAGGLDWKTMPIMVLPTQDDPFDDLLDLIGVQSKIHAPMRLPQSVMPLLHQDAVVTAPVLDVQF